MVNVLGPLPEQWKEHYKGSSGYNAPCQDWWYDQSRKLDPTMSLEAMIKRARPEASEAEQSTLLSLMSKGFSYLPESRISAEQLLQDTSFKAIQVRLATAPYKMATSVTESTFGACASHEQREYSISISLRDPTLVQLMSGRQPSSDCTLAFRPDLPLDHYLSV